MRAIGLRRTCEHELTAEHGIGDVAEQLALPDQPGRGRRAAPRIRSAERRRARGG